MHSAPATVNARGPRTATISGGSGRRWCREGNPSEVVDSQPSGSSCTSGCGGAGGGVPLLAGQNTVSVTITVEFQLE